MPNGTEGVAKFFAGLGGGPALRQQAEANGRLDAMREALTDAQIRNTGADADLKGIKLGALDPATLAQAFAGMGLDATQSQGASGLARAGNNANEIGGLMKTLQGLAVQRAARDAAVRGDLNGANANLFGVADKPVTLSQITDGVALNPTVTPDANAFDPTAVGQAMINAHNAAAGNSAASAKATLAKLPEEIAHLRAETSKAGTSSNNLPPISDVTAILPKQPVAGNPFAPPSTDPAAVAQVLGWLAQNHGQSVGNYVNQAPVGSPGALPPTGALPLSLPTAPVATPAGAPAPAVDPASLSQIPGLSAILGHGAPSTEAPADPSAPTMPSSKEAFDALPAGALFVNPADGRVMRKK